MFRGYIKMFKASG